MGRKNKNKNRKKAGVKEEADTADHTEEQSTAAAEEVKEEV